MKALSSLALPAALLLLAAAPQAQCGTTIAKTVNGETWTPAGSPYCVVARVSVQNLTILPGTTIRVTNNNWLQIDGQINAVGSALQPILFTADDPNPAMGWRGLLFRAGVTAPTSQLTHCIFEGCRIGPALGITDSPVVIDHCTFRLMQRGCIRANMASGDVIIRDCVFNGGTLNTNGGVEANLGDGDLTIERCRFTSNVSNGSGGAIDATLSDGNMRVDDCVFSDNSAVGDGGAILASVTGGQLEVNRCTFVNNRADARQFIVDSSGGAVFVVGDAVIRDCDFVSNTCRGHRISQVALGRGGALFVAAGNVSVESCLFRRNQCIADFENVGIDGRAYALGGAIHVGFGNLAATNCLLSENGASAMGTSNTQERGGNIYVEGLPAAFVNCTIIDGTTMAGGDGGLYVAGGNPTIRNSILWGNDGPEFSGGGVPTISYSNVDGGAPPGTGNISVDPQFSAPGCGYLTAGSPCIDAGDPSPADDDVCFPPSLGGTRNDMGAHGGPLACGWQRPVAPLLSVAGALGIAAPATVTLDVVRGNPGSPAAVFITSVDGVPLPFIWLPPLITLCDGTGSLSINVPATAKPVTIGFQAFSLDAFGGLIGTNAADVTLR